MSALEIQEEVSGYECLAAVLADAYDQAAIGKGAERHADGRAFDEQPMQQLIDLYGPGFALGQAAKKAQESQRMKPDAARRELLGAIVYLAGAIVSLDRKNAALELSPEILAASNDNEIKKGCNTCRHFDVVMCTKPASRCFDARTYPDWEPRSHG